MKRQVRLYIGGQEADLSGDGLILFNHTLEDLSNPTIVKNSYTQQVTLKGTPANNDIFGHIWRLDRDQRFGGSTGTDFDPSRKTGFRLFDGTGDLLESGYVKLDNVLRHGADVQYAVTLYGGLGGFLYGLSFDAEGNRRTLADLDYLGTGDPDRELDFTIDAEAVTGAWERLLTNPSGVSDIWDVINFAPCYNGVPDRFGADKALVRPTEIGLPGSHAEDSSYTTLNGWALLKMTRNMAEWEVKDLRSYLQRPVLSVRAALGAIARKAAADGITFDASVLDGSEYDGMWVTLPLLPGLDTYKNVQRSITLTVDGSAHSDTFSVPVSIGTPLQVGSKVDVSMNLSLGMSVSGATATPLYLGAAKYTTGIGTTERYDFSGLFVQLVAYDANDREVAASKVVCVGSSDDYGQFAKDGKTRADACGYTPIVDMDYTYVEAVLAGASGSYRLSSDINLSVSCYNAERYRVWVTPYHFRKTIHFGELYRKTWRSHSLGTDAMRAYSGGVEYTYTSMRLSSGSAGSTASYKTPESVRSGAAVSKAMLLTTSYSPADFLLGITKSLGLLLRYDGTAQTVTVMSRNDWFRPGVTDIDARIDRGREIRVAPLTFDTKWLEFSAGEGGSAFGKYYADLYGSVYGTQRVGTGYDFNNESREIMDSVIFRGAVQACENSRYFNDVSAGGTDVLSQQLDNGNVLAYRNASGDTKDWEVPVASSPDITYWGSPSFDDTDGYDWLTATKPQFHDADGKPLDGSGVLLWRTGAQSYGRFQVSDDLPEMMTLNDGTPCWRCDAGEGVTVPVFSRFKTNPIYALVSTSPPEFEYRGEGVVSSLDFGRVRELACPHMDYFPGRDTVTVYERMWRAYIRDRYDVNTRVVTCRVNMAGIQVDGRCLRRLWWFDNAVWSLNRIINHSVTTDDPTECEFVKVGDEAAYLYGQVFGGTQARGTLTVTVTPANASVTVDGTPLALSGGTGSVTVSAGQHVVRASSPGYATAERVVAVPADETATVTITLEPGSEQLNIIVLPSDASPVIALTVNGVSTPYTAGMNVTDGATVSVTVSASGYATQSRTFTMSAANATQTFTLVADIEATISWPSSVSSAAQNVPFTISDPSGHGWLLDYDGPYTYGFITGGGVTSGSATAGAGYIEGTGNASVYLTVTANTTPVNRSINAYPFRFTDSVTRTRTSVSIQQLASGGGDVKVTSVTVSPSTLSLNVGASANLSATVLPSNATNKSLTWSSSDTSVATVSQTGRVTAVGTGTATIRATATDGSNKYGTCAVTVTSSDVPVTGVSVTPSTLNLSVGGSATLVASVRPTNATDKSVTWTSINPAVATVSSSGVVTAIGVGTTNVTVRTNDGNYTATCRVTVTASGTMSADDITMTGTATSASTELRTTGMNAPTINATCDADWVTGVDVDITGSVYYVRLTTTQNVSASPSRTATVQLSGYDEASHLITASFTVTQNVKSVYDIPCTAITIDGAPSIQNSGNSSEYTAGYQPDGCTMPYCVWSIVGDGGDYIRIDATGNTCVVTVKPGAENNLVTIKATNSYNGVEGIKTIEVTYVRSSNISVNPSSVRVLAGDTSNATPAITATGIRLGSLAVKSVHGFIDTAEIANGHLYTYFTENTTQDVRSGSVVLSAIDSGSGTEVTAEVNYTQSYQSTSSNTFEIMGLSVNESGDKVYVGFRVDYTNTEPDSYTFTGLYYTLVGYDSGDAQSFLMSGLLPDKLVAAATTETETYQRRKVGDVGLTVRYVLTVANESRSDTYSGDGHDII